VLCLKNAYTDSYGLERATATRLEVRTVSLYYSRRGVLSGYKSRSNPNYVSASITTSHHFSNYPLTMKQSLLIAAGISGIYATSLSNICNVDYITNSLPSDGSAIQGLVYGDVTAQPIYNSSVEAGNNYPAASGRNFCNVTVAYNHAGKDDAVSIGSIDPQLRGKLVLTLCDFSDQCMVLFP